MCISTVTLVPEIKPSYRVRKEETCYYSHVNSRHPRVIFHAFLSSADLFQNQLFGKILSGIPSECQLSLDPYCRA